MPCCFWRREPLRPSWAVTGRPEPVPDDPDLVCRAGGRAFGVLGGPRIQARPLARLRPRTRRPPWSVRSPAAGAFRCQASLSAPMERRSPWAATRRSWSGTWSRANWPSGSAPVQIGSMVQAVVFKQGRQGPLAAAEGTPARGGRADFDPQSGQLAASFQEPKGVVFCLAVSPDGKFLAGGCGDALAYVWSLEEEACDHAQRHSLPVVSVAFGGDAKSAFLATASLDKTVQVWEAGTWKPDRVTTTLEARCNAVSCSRSPETPASRTGWRSSSAVTTADRSKFAWTTSAGLGPKPRRQARHRRRYALGLPLAQRQGPLEVVPILRLRRLQRCDRQGLRLRPEARQIQPSAATAAGCMPWRPTRRERGWRRPAATGASSSGIPPTAARWPRSWSLPGKDDWLVVSGQGYYATSTPAAVQADAAGVKASPEKLSGLQNPEMVRQTLAGKRVPPPVLQ